MREGLSFLSHVNFLWMNEPHATEWIFPGQQDSCFLYWSPGLCWDCPGTWHLLLPVNLFCPILLLWLLRLNHQALSFLSFPKPFIVLAAACMCSNCAVLHTCFDLEPRALKAALQSGECVLIFLSTPKDLWVRLIPPASIPHFPREVLLSLCFIKGHKYDLRELRRIFQPRCYSGFLPFCSSFDLFFFFCLLVYICFFSLSITYQIAPQKSFQQINLFC